MDAADLRALPPLVGVSDTGLERVASCSAELEADAGQVIVVPDDPGSGMFILCDGTVVVELRSGPIELGPGDFFGELALLAEHGARLARVRATPRDDFIALVETEPSFALHILRELARRLTEARTDA